MRQTSTYKTVDELPNLLDKAKQPEFKSVDELPDLKKKVSGDGSKEPLDGGLSGTTSTTEPIPTIEMYQTPTGDLTEDPFAQVKKSKELSGKTKVISIGNVGGAAMGTTGSETIADETAVKEAKEIKEELKKKGYKEDFFAGISDLPEDVYNNPTTSKETLSVLYKNNPVKFTQLTNEAKNKYAIRDAAAKKAYDEAQGDEKQKTEYASRVGILKGNEYSGDEIAPPENMQQFYDIVRQKQQLIDQNIDSPEEKKKAHERLRQTYAQAINPTSLDFREEYENSGLADKLDVTQYAGLKTYELFEPEKAKVLRSMVEANITPQWNVNVQVTPEEQVRSIVTDSAMAEKMGGVISELTTNQRIAKEEALRELSLVGATNEYDSIVSEQNDLKNKYKEAQTDEEKAIIYAKMLLNEQRANDLQKTEAKNDERYPITAKLKMDNLVKEIVQDRGIGVGGWMYNKYAHGVGSGVDAVENLVTSIFGSEKEKTDLRMKRIGEGKQFEASIYLPESERSINSPVIIQASDELKKKAKEILNGRSLSELSADEKDKLSQLVASNQDQIKTITNPEAGKSKNFWSKATGMTIAGFTSDMGAFLTKMGLMQGVGMGAKAAEATTLFMDGYEPAFNKKLSEGASVEAANEYGILHGAVLSLMSKFGSKYETIKNVVKGGSSPISKYIAGLSEESWNKLAAESKPLLSKVGTAVKDVAKEQGKMIGTFGIAAPVASAVADNLFYDENKPVKEIVDEAFLSAKEMAIGGIGFGLFGLAKGVMKTKATPVEKAALSEMADFQELGKMRIDEAVKAREISKEEGERKKAIIDNVSKLVEQVPETNDKGKPLTDQQRSNYLFNLAVKESQKEKAKNLPEKQAEEAKQKALVADKENQIELEALTEKQLNDRKDKLEKAISKLDEKGKPELSDKEMADAKAELEAVNNIIKAKGDTTKSEEKLPEPIEGVDEFGVPIGENVPAETNPLTKEAEDLLASIGEGSKPTFITKNLERIAKENGIEVTDKMSADDVINALKEKQKQQSEQVGSVGGDVEFKNEGKADTPTQKNVQERTGINHPFMQKVSEGLRRLGILKNGESAGAGYVQGIKGGGFTSRLTPLKDGKFLDGEAGSIIFKDDGSISVSTEKGSINFDKNGNIISHDIKEKIRTKQDIQNDIDSKTKSKQDFEKIRDSEDFKYKDSFEYDPNNPLSKGRKVKIPKTDTELKESTDKINKVIDKLNGEINDHKKELETAPEQSLPTQEVKAEQPTVSDNPALANVEATAKALDNKINITREKGGFVGDFLNDYELIGEGSEHTVYRSKDGSHVIRISEPYNDKSESTLNARINDAMLISEIIGDGSLEVIGYYESQNGTKNPIYRQKFQEGTPISEQEAVSYLQSIGAIEYGDKYNRGYLINHNGKWYKISDLTDNFFRNKDGEINAIDAAIQEISQKEISEAYHKAKKDGSNPELVKAVEDLLGKPKTQTSEQPTKPVTKPIPEVTETTQQQGIKEAVPEGTIETGRTEPEGAAAVLDADVKKAILDAAIDKKSEKGKQMAMEEEAAKYGKQGAKILSEIRGGEPPKPPTGEFKTVEDIGGQDLSGIRKALVSDKIIEGVDLERVSDKEMMSMGRKILDTGEIKPEALVEKIITDGKGVLTPTEVVGLITYKRDIDNALQDTYTKIAEKKAKGEDIGTLGVEAKNLERQIHDFDVMAVITAQQQSMAFRLRQRMLDREYNVVTQIEKYKANNNGEIEADVEAKFRELDKQLKDVKDKLIDAEKRLSEKEGQDAVNNIKESVEREKTYTEEELDKKINEGVEKEIAKLYEELPSDKKSAADKAIKALEKFREKIKRRTYESTLGIPMAIADLGAATAIRAIKVGKTVAEAVEIGINRIKKALKEKGIDTWEKESEYRKDLTTTLEEEGVSTKKKPKDKPVINEDGTVSIPNEMLRDLVKRGITDINDLTKAVHDQVKKDLPDISERQVRDYITDYGKKVNPTADEIQIQVNTAKRIGRLLSELDDIQNKIKKNKNSSNNKLTDKERELKRQINSLSKDIFGKEEKSDEQKLADAKRRVKDRIDELNRKIKNKDFAKPEKKLQPTDNELVELNAEKERLQEEFDKEQYALELKNRNVWQKWEDRAYEATSGLMRGLTLGVDLSAAGVQGMRRLFTNPKESAIAFWDGLKFLVSEKGANAYMDKQKAQPYYPLLRATKLAIDDKSGKQSVKEGMFVSEWINFIWNKAIAPVAGLGTKWGTDFVRKINPYAASQRAYDGYVNSIRIQTYLKLAKELSRDGYTYETDPKVFDKMADFVNTTTGRGSLGAADANSRWLNVFLTAPRKVISEVKLYTPYAFVYYARMPKVVRMKALKDFAQFTGTFLAVNALMWAARKNWDNDEDDDNFWNMNSSDFLTHKFGDKRVSIGGGMKSILTMQARFLTGKYTDQYGVTTKLGDRYGKPINTRLDLVTRFAIGKAAPVFNVLAKKLDERAGRPVENEELIKNISVPLWIQDVGDLYKNDPNSVAPLLMTLSILGANVRTVDKSKSQLQSEELLKEPIFKEYIGKGINFPELNPEKIQTKEVNGKVVEKLSDYDTKVQEDFIKKKKEYLKQEFLKLKNGTIKVYVDNYGNATTTPSRRNKLKSFNQLTKEQIQNVISTSISGHVTEKVKKEVLKGKSVKEKNN